MRTSLSSNPETARRISNGIMRLAWQLAPDADGDTISDDIDNCSQTPNVDQRDIDEDGYGNACDCDLNNDDIVNLSDYLLFSQEWGQTGSNYADFNADELVNLADYAIFGCFWGTQVPWF
jgi:hypothetical protein